MPGIYTLPAHGTQGRLELAAAAVWRWLNLDCGDVLNVCLAEVDWLKFHG